jgi:hypothetical protein
LLKKLAALASHGLVLLFVAHLIQLLHVFLGLLSWIDFIEAQDWQDYLQKYSEAILGEEILNFLIYLDFYKFH